MLKVSKKVQLFSLSKVEFYEGWKPIYEFESQAKRWEGEGNVQKQMKNEA